MRTTCYIRNEHKKDIPPLFTPQLCKDQGFADRESSNYLAQYVQLAPNLIKIVVMASGFRSDLCICSNILSSRFS